MKESRNWLEMPPEVMENILQRIGIEEILSSARKVCTTWRRICKDPAMWKVIDMSHHVDVDLDSEILLQTLVKEAVDLSCGELIEISIGWFAYDDLLDYIVRASSKLKHVCLLSQDITGKALTQASKRVPQLERLQFTYTDMIAAKHIEDIGRNCPELNSFKVEGFGVPHNTCDNYALAIANSMPELRHLQVSHTEMTNIGLQAILNGCPHLQSLHVCMRSKLHLVGNLGKLCNERIKDFKCDEYSEDDIFALFEDDIVEYHYHEDEIFGIP